MYLLKYLAQAGVAARRKAEVMIREGQVTVDGAVVTDPAFQVDQQVVAVGGRPVMAEPKEYWLLNKPSGVVSTAADEHGRQTAVELINSTVRLYPVGRLDADTVGLLLLTNDGNLAHRLTHPKFELHKTYQAVMVGEVSDEAIDLLRSGVELDDGITAPAEVRVLSRTSRKTRLELQIHEGRNRQVRRMGTAIGHPVVYLERTKLATLKLDGLKPGGRRQLTVGELNELRVAAGLS